jgi:hypothetical protein
MTCKGVSAAITGYELVSGAVVVFKALDDVVGRAGAKVWNQLNPPTNGMLLGEVPIGPPAAGAAGLLGAVEESATSALTRWGWTGTKKFLAAVRTLKQPGTHELVEGIVPTVEEAKQLIQKAGGTVDRIEEGHAVGGVSEHTYPHINYTTASGSKATVRVESTGK